MKTFRLHLQDATHVDDFDDVVSFVGEDASGSLGILAGHTRLITVLVVGLARFSDAHGRWRYLAMPGAVLRFDQDRLSLDTRRYLIDSDYRRISEALQRQLLDEEERLHGLKESLHRMEDAVLQRLWEIARGRAE